MMKPNTSLFICIIGLLFIGCNSSTSTDNSKPYIVATTGMLADAVKNIVGDSVIVEALMGPGVDPHLYKATQGDLTKLTQASVIVYNGLHLEGKMGEVLENLGRRKSVIAGGDGVPKELRRNSTQYENAYDPHIWFDVSKWKLVVEHLSNELQVIYPDRATEFKQNANEYLEKLDVLHSYVTTQIQTIPKRQRTLITAHDAFEYFGEAYDMEVRGLQGISTVSEFGLRDVTNLVDFIVSKEIKAVFVETSVSQRAINAVVEGCQQQNFNVVIGGSLYSDAMGKEGTPEGTYIGMVTANVNTIVNALK